MTRVVVVGNGMAGARLVEDLGTSGQRLHLTVFGGEPGLPYNRVLLSELLAGRTRPSELGLVDENWYEQHDVDVRPGVHVTGLDRERRIVLADDGTTTPYDVLVLATGSTAVVPAVPGLHTGSGALVGGALPFRTLSDCTRIDAATASARSVAVLGGGLLGIEAARALAGRGLPVIVIHPFGHLMERQLDPGAGDVLTRVLGRLGVDVRVGVGAASAAAGPAGLSHLELTDGTVVPCDLLVVACGVLPRTELARVAGLEVGRGIVVDDQLRSVSDPRIFAVGECAEHDGRVYGLVAPAWEQAAVVAGVLTGSAPDATYGGSRVITRLKAAGVDLAALGDTAPSPGSTEVEVVQYVDAARGIYKKLVLRDGRLTGAILLGDGRSVGEVVQLHDRGSLVPRDPATLLFPGAGAPAAPDVASVPDGATVCHCSGVSKSELVTGWSEGDRTVDALARRTRATTGCGTCSLAVQGLCDWLAAREAPATDGQAVRPPAAPERRWTGSRGGRPSAPAAVPAPRAPSPAEVRETTTSW